MEYLLLRFSDNKFRASELVAASIAKIILGVLVAVEVPISFVLMSCQVVFLVIPYPRMFPGLFPMSVKKVFNANEF